MKRIAAVIAAVGSIVGLALGSAGAASASPVINYTGPAPYNTYPSANQALPYADAVILMPDVNIRPGMPLYLHVYIPDPRAIGSLELTSGVLHCAGCRGAILLQENADKVYEFTYNLGRASSGSFAVYAITITFRNHRDYREQSLYPSMWLASR
jgi:hypothetical protein